MSYLPLAEIRAVELRFARDEVAGFLAQVVGRPPTDEDVAALEQRTEGWVAGRQLAARSLRGRSATSNFVATGLSDRQVAATMIVAIGMVKRHLHLLRDARRRRYHYHQLDTAGSNSTGFR